MLEGTVIKSTGSWYSVQLDGGDYVDCRIIGRFRLDGKRLTNPVAVGDRVRLELEGEEQMGIIREILPRKNYVVRQSPRKKHELHLLASNVDQAVVLITISNPKLKQGFIDRFLLMTEPYDIPTLIVCNKADLYSEEDLAIFEYLQSIYGAIGYQMILTSAVDGTGVKELGKLLANKVNLLAGQSGVGKSSLVNRLQPGLELRTSELSDYTGKGMHTTTFAQMYDLEGGGKIIDTPGIKTLGFNHLEPMDIAHNFREFFALSEECRFGGTCLHRNEPGCAVKEALEAETVSELRYINYLTLLEEIEEQNYWERNTDY
jgi:ribosome biogenesis GTPase